MIKLNENHYIFKLFNDMIKYGIGCMQIGAITAILQRPKSRISVYTLSLINRDIQKGLVFNLLKNQGSTTIIESKICGSEVWYEQQATLSSAKLFNI